MRLAVVLKFDDLEPQFSFGLCTHGSLHAHQAAGCLDQVQSSSLD
jgi:hypothetical protein